MTKVTITTDAGRATIEVPEEDLTIDDVLQFLVRPALIGVGYHPDLVDQAFVYQGFSEEDSEDMIEEIIMGSGVDENGEVIVDDNTGDE